MDTIIERILLKDGFDRVQTNVNNIRIYLIRDGKRAQVVIISDLDEKEISPLEYTCFVERILADKEGLNVSDIRCTGFFYSSDISKAVSLCSQSSERDERFLVLKPDEQVVLLDVQKNEPGEFAVNIISRMEGKKVKPVINKESAIKQYLTPVNMMIIIANILMFVYLELYGSTKDADYLFEKGGIYWESILYDHEYYRLLMAMFMHAGFEHLAGNMVSLFFIGGCLERIVGRKKYLLLYFTSGILAGVTSVLYNMNIGDEVVCVGASGAIFGVVGAVLGAMIMYKKIGERFGVGNLMAYIFISIVTGISSSDVDNAAHIGGLVAGFICSLVIYSLFPLDGKRCSDAG